MLIATNLVMHHFVVSFVWCFSFHALVSWFVGQFSHERFFIGVLEPDYVSLNLGIFLCRKCARIHAKLSGTANSAKGFLFVSKIRPAYCFVWQPEVAQVMKSIGNGEANKHWERNLASFGTAKPIPSDPMYFLLFLLLVFQT